MAVASSILSGFASAGSAVRQSAANQRSKRATERAVDQLDIGDKPVAAEYKPIDFTAEQLASVQGNIHNLDAINQLDTANNTYVTGNDVRRASALIPGYKSMMQQLGADASPLLQGELPYDDVLGIVGNSTGRLGALNIAGTAGPATARDLGLSRLDAIGKGAGLMQQMVQTAQTISPVERQMTPQMSMLSPSDRIRWGMEQNQIIQQSDQNRNNIEASVSPTDYAKQVLGLGLGLAGQDTRTNWESVIGKGLSGITSGLGGMGGGGGGGMFGGGGAGSVGTSAPGSISIPSQTYSGWAGGPQPGTYYIPHASPYSIPAY